MDDIGRKDLKLGHSQPDASTTSQPKTRSEAMMVKEAVGVGGGNACRDEQPSPALSQPDASPTCPHTDVIGHEWSSTCQLCGKTWSASSSPSPSASPIDLMKLLQPLKDACDRDWKDKTPEQIVAIAANAIYWRGKGSAPQTEPSDRALPEPDSIRISASDLIVLAKAMKGKEYVDVCISDGVRRIQFIDQLLGD